MYTLNQTGKEKVRDKITKIAQLGGELDELVRSGMSDDETLALAFILDVVLQNVREMKTEIFDKRIDKMKGIVK